VLFWAAGLGTAACTHTCAGSSAGFLWLPVGLSASTFLVDRRGFALELGAGYRFYFADVGSSDARRLRWRSPTGVESAFVTGLGLTWQLGW
jgi:hypothetical protein